MTVRILITGGAGQIGLELARQSWGEGVELHLPTREELNLSSADSIASCMAHGSYAAVINSAAWTAVDLAEDNVADAFLINAQGPAWLAESARTAGIPFVQVSTDYVFDGSLDRPWREDDPVAPLGVYGASKLAGELAVRAAQPRSVILRTAWVLSVYRANFLKTMLRVGAERDQLSVVADQIGCPTSGRDIASAIRTITLRLIADEQAPTGVYHFVNAGKASWFELASEIFAIASPLGGALPELVGITSADYPTRARRPANSRLDCSKITQDFGIFPREWHEAVHEIVSELLTAQTDKGV